MVALSSENHLQPAISDYIAERAVIIAGTSGVGLRQLYNDLRGHPKWGQCVFNYEDTLLEDKSINGCVSIFEVASMIPIARDASKKVFEEAVRRLRDMATARGCSKLIVFTHLTYLTENIILANPALGSLLRLAREISVVYVVDDYYDALYRISQKLESVVARDPSTGTCRVGPPTSPFRITPRDFLAWRASDYNLLTALESFHPALRAILFASKHPHETFRRLLNSLLSDGESGRAKLAYASHPITYPRSLYGHGLYATLEREPIVIAVEAFKWALRDHDRTLILFEPTTVDELLQDPLGTIVEIVFGDLDEFVKKVKMARKLEEGASEKTEKENELDQKIKEILDVPVLNPLIIRRRSRWPLHPKGLLEVQSEGKGYPCRNRERVNLLDPRGFVDLYGGLEKLDEMQAAISEGLVASVVRLLARLEREPEARYKVVVPLAPTVVDDVKKQIEMRDYHYVTQSSFIITINTAITVLEKDLEVLAQGIARRLAQQGEKRLEASVEPKALRASVSEVLKPWQGKIFLPHSSGVEAELHRAKALAKPTILYVLPVSIAALLLSSKPLERLGEDIRGASNAGTEDPISVIAERLKQAASLAIENPLKAGSLRVCSAETHRAGREVEVDTERLIARLASCISGGGLLGLFRATGAGTRYCVVPYVYGWASDDLKCPKYEDCLKMLKNRYLQALKGSCGGSPGAKTSRG